MEPHFGPINNFMHIFKSEARISKPETNSKFEMMNDQNNKKGAYPRSPSYHKKTCGSGFDSAELVAGQPRN
jgi:hypothetical protein